MSTNLATILVGLGYDLSALEKGAPEAFRLINQQTLGMSAEMKRSSREGAESWRLIDEALGIHVSRPLTRIVTQEFPGFAKAMQSLLGAGVVGALGLAGIEFFDKIAKGIEHAQKAQEEFAEASRKVNTVFEDAMQSYEQADKLRSLSGLNLELFKIDSASIDEARHKIDDLAASVADLQKKEEAASGFFTKIGAAIGNAAHTLYYTPTEQSVERIGKQTEEFTEKFNELSKLDALKGTKESAKFVADQLSIAQAKLDDMSSHSMGALQTFLRDQLPVTQKGQFGYSQAEIDRMHQYVMLLERVQSIEAAAAHDEGAKDSAARTAEAMAQQKTEIAELQGDLKRWNDAANESWQSWMKINAEIESATDKLKDSAVSDFAARSAQIKKIFFPEVIAPPPGAPTLKDQNELRDVTTDQLAAWKTAGQVLEQIETPAQKYAAALQLITELQRQGRLTTDQFALAQQKLAEQLQSSEDRMAKLMREGGAAGGAQAFVMQLMGDTSKGSTGQFTFDLLNRGLQGFEDETVKALTTGKANWRQYFEGLDQMALKFVENRAFAELFKMLGTSSFGKSLGIGDLFGNTNPAQLANTTALTANTAALAANTAVLTTAAAGSVGVGAGKSLFDLGIPAFASGTDYAPGGMSLVGENGPELVNLPSGASVTPNSTLRSGINPTVHINIDAKGAQMGVAEQIAKSWEQHGPALVMRAVVEAAESSRRSLASKY
jgi:hypothetical protein